jgi:hypothetical protein
MKFLLFQEIIRSGGIDGLPTSSFLYLGTQVAITGVEAHFDHVRTAFPCLPPRPESLRGRLAIRVSFLDAMRFLKVAISVHLD